MYRVDEIKLPLVLTNLFNKIKESGILPSEWTKWCNRENTEEGGFKRMRKLERDYFVTDSLEDVL